MIAIKKVISTSFKNGVRLIKGLVMGKSDVRTMKQISPFGFDSNPTNDKRGLYVSTTTVGKYYSIGVINTNCKAESGESRIFSTDEQGKTVKFNLWLKSDGTLLQGTSDSPSAYTNFAVKYNELKTDIDALKATINANAVTFNTHTHILTLTSGTGTAAPSVTQNQQNNTDFSNIKHAKIKYND